MSETKIHFGKLRRPYPAMLTEGKTLDDFYKERCATKGVTELIDGNRDWRQQFLDTFSDIYVVVDGSVFEIIENEEGETGDSFVKMFEYQEPNGETTISFVTSFYNGGTYLQEMLEDGLRELLKNKK